MCPKDCGFGVCVLFMIRVNGCPDEYVAGFGLSDQRSGECVIQGGSVCVFAEVFLDWKCVLYQVVCIANVQCDSQCYREQVS